MQLYFSAVAPSWKTCAWNCTAQERAGSRQVGLSAVIALSFKHAPPTSCCVSTTRICKQARQKHQISNTTATSKMDSSPFARLPGELRNQIWRLSVIKPDGVNMSYKQRTSNEPTLLATCRQIRREASGIYYAENAFFADTEYSANFYMNDWLSTIGATRAGMIRDLRVCCTTPSEFAKPSISFDEVVREVRGSSLEMWSLRRCAEMEVDSLLRWGVRPEAVRVMHSTYANDKRDGGWVVWKETLEEELEKARREGRVAMGFWGVLRYLFVLCARALNPWGALD